MGYKSSSENPSDVDSEMNDSFQSIVSISEISEINQNIDDFENILPESESNTDSEQINTNYPNKAYGDLMSLVTKHKLNNVTGNAIIKFFNKHANLDKSPLPKSIEQGRKYMDNMNLPSLNHTKTCVINYNNNEYYLYHRPLLNCIKNILSIPDILENFALTFEKTEVIILSFM